MAGRYVGKGRRIRVKCRPCRCYHRYLGKLSPGHIGKWSECAIIVATHYIIVCGCLYEGIEGVAGRHISEGRCSWSVDLVPERQNNDLDRLPTRGSIVWVEGAVRVAGDCSITIEIPRRLVEVVRGMYVIE